MESKDINFDDWFKRPTEDETDRQYLTQLCYDGQMDDSEIDEFVDAIINWKDKKMDFQQSEINRLKEEIQKLKKPTGYHDVEKYYTDDIGNGDEFLSQNKH